MTIFLSFIPESFLSNASCWWDEVVFRKKKIGSCIAHTSRRNEERDRERFESEWMEENFLVEWACKTLSVNEALKKLFQNVHLWYASNDTPVVSDWQYVSVIDWCTYCTSIIAGPWAMSAGPWSPRAAWGSFGVKKVLLHMKQDLGGSDQLPGVPEAGLSLLDPSFKPFPALWHPRPPGFGHQGRYYCYTGPEGISAFITNLNCKLE